MSMIQEPVHEKSDPKSHLKQSTLPMHNGTASGKKTKGIRAAGESGRSGFNPLKFLTICTRSSCTLSKCTNFLWPFVPAALVLHWARPEQELWNFILPYIAMIPSANLLAFSSNQIARKLPHVLGIILELTFGSVVEIILFIVLIKQGESGVPIIKAAILGSILANLLLCLGACFFAGGIRPGRKQVTFNDAVSEVGSNLMLVAGMGLIVPAIFSAALSTNENSYQAEVLSISRATSVILLLAFFIYGYFQMSSHKGIYEEMLITEENIEKYIDRKDNPKLHRNLTLIEAIFALLFSLAMVSIMAIFLVTRIEYIVEKRHIKDAFVGLILVPLVEKAAEHIAAVDEAWDNQMNLALAHVLGSSIQTALFNTPLIVLIGWGLRVPMDLNFEIFDAAVLILAILVVGNFLRDAKTDYLEGVLCVFVYVIIAIAAFYYPNPAGHGGESSSGSEGH